MKQVTRFLPGMPRLALILGVSILMSASVRRAQNPAAGPTEQEKKYWARMETADRQIAAEVKAHSELMKNLEYLTTQIGPRLTGSPEMQKASAWTLQRFKDYGFDAHLETTQVSHAWYRGLDSAEIVTPLRRTLEIHSYGWGKATDGDATGPVVFLADVSQEAVEKQRDKLKGAIVAMGNPRPVPPAGQPAANAFDASEPESAPGHHRDPNAPPGLSFADRLNVYKLVADAGALALLSDSNKPDGLFNMSRVAPCCDPGPLPAAFITHEDYGWLYRLSQAGPVSMRINLKGTFSPGPAPASITVAEIKGSELPEERVIIGGHLDSWDLGQGALDNGTGAMATLEAARAMKALGWKPKRTLTFILFVGEELGGIGSKLYLSNHQAEVPKIDAALVLDTGTGRVTSIALENLWETARQMSTIYHPLQDVFDLFPLEARFYDGSDHISFIRAGVPGYICVQAPALYREVHHSQSDTFDKAVPEEINQAAAVIASWLWNVSEYPEALPHHPSIPHETYLGTPTP